MVDMKAEVYDQDWRGVKVSAAELEQIQLHPKMVCPNGRGLSWINEGGGYESRGGLPSYRHDAGGLNELLEWRSRGQWHRVDGPARINKKIANLWALAGVQYKTEDEWKQAKLVWEQMTEAEHEFAFRTSRMPRMEGGTIKWIVGDKYHTDGSIPAYRDRNGHKEWLSEGKRHRLDGPAIVFADGAEQHYIHGLFIGVQDFAKYKAQIDAGLITTAPVPQGGFECRSTKTGNLHADGVPAVRYADGKSTFCKDGLLHNEAGPASETGSYWLDGYCYKTKTGWQRRVNQLKRKREEGAKKSNPVDEFFNNLRSNLTAEKAKKINSTYLFDIGGEKC